MKRFIGLLTILLVTGIAFGQDSLDVRYVRDVPGGSVLYVDDAYRVGVETKSGQGEWGDYYDTTYVAIYDNRDPAWPSLVWRGLPVVGGGYYGVYYDAYIFSAVELRDSLIYAVQSCYNVYDVPGGYLFSNLICYDWVNEDTLWLRDFRYDYDGDYIRPFTYPRGLEIEGNQLAVGLGINGFHIYDISDLGEPQPIYTLERSTIDLKQAGENLILCYLDTLNRNEFHNLRLFDWNNPAVALDSIYFDDPFLYNVQIHSSGERIFASFEDSIGVWKITDEGQFAPDIGVHPDSEITSFSVSGDTVAIGRERGFDIWRASEGNEPELLRRVEHGEPYDFAGTVLRGEWIYRESSLNWLVPLGGSIDLFHLGPVSVPDHEVVLPQELLMCSAYPNPFNSMTTIRYELPTTGDVLMNVLDMSGRIVHEELISGEAGKNSISLDAASLPAGIYLVQLEASGVVERVKIVLVR